MQNLTDVRQSSALTPFRVSQAQEFPIIHVNHKDYVMVPADSYRTIQSNRTGWMILAVSGGVLAVSTAVAIVASAFRPPLAAPEPVIVEKQVVVPTNCLIWCGQ